MIIRSYRELKKLNSFEERYNYLKIGAGVGFETFGSDRYVNQALYQSKEWRKVRDQVILRDNGCDLGIEGYKIFEKPIIHHMNPITLEDILERRDCVFDLDNLITTTHRTHNAIHYGTEAQIYKGPIIRLPNDTCPWRKGE